MRLRKTFYDALHPAVRHLSRSRAVVRWLFGVSLPAGLRVHFDPTTILLARVLQRIGTSGGERALEVGVGQGALIGLSLALSTGILLDGIDCDPACVKSSDRVARHNGVRANFYVGHFFDALPPGRRYDLVFFNPPYVPTQRGHDLRLTERMQGANEHAWNGGEDGTVVFREFLRRAPAVLSPGGRVLFGVQPVFVADALVRRTLAAIGWRLVRRHTRAFVPSVAYEVIPAPPAEESATTTV